MAGRRPPVSWPWHAETAQDGGHAGLLAAGRRGLPMWDSALHVLARTPAGQLDQAKLRRCRESDGDRPQVRAWLDFTEALAGWNHRYDVEIGTTTGQEPEATDISLR